jgi:Protein of unknown function (DUF2384)
MARAQQWLSQPHPTLGGMTPNGCANNDLNLQKARDLMAEHKHGANAGSATNQNDEKQQMPIRNTKRTPCLVPANPA